MARYRIGNDITVVWTVNDREGNAFPLVDKDVHLYYTCERGRYEADIQIQDTNKIVWEFFGSLQKALGAYSLTLEILQSDGKRSIKKDICNAFVFVGKDCEADSKAESTNGDIAVYQETITTNLDVCRINPIMPTIVKDESGIGYWVIDGVNTGERATGEGPYEFAVRNGYEGTEEEFAQMLLTGGDWNAQANEAGYISNRTHYSSWESTKISIDLTTVKSGDIIPLGFVIGESTKMRFNGGSVHDIPANGQEFLMETQGPNMYARIYTEDQSYLEIRTNSFGIKNTIEFGDAIIKHLPEMYIPSSIARKSEVPTKLSQLEIDTEIGGATPDWNASEGEKGFIKNRTHYHDFIVKATVDITNVSSGAVLNLGFYVDSNTKVRNTITGGIGSVPVDEEFYLPTQGPSVRAKIINTTASQLHILSSPVGVSNELEFGQEIIQPLDDKFIPDSIARKSEIPTGYDDTELKNAIAEKVDEDDVKDIILEEHVYYKYVTSENKVYFKGLNLAYKDWTLLNGFAINYAVHVPITAHMLIEDGDYIRVSTNKFEVRNNSQDVFGLFWVYGDLKYTASFDEKNNQVITTEPYNEGEGSSAIPDWNASEGEAGFIKNKTHGYKKYITVSAGRNIMNDFNGQRMFLYALDGKIYTLNLSYPVNTTIGEGDTEAIVTFNFDSQVSISVTPVGANTQNVDVYGWLLEDDIYEPLADGFIPDTIARKSELTELSAEVSGLSERIDNLPTAESDVFNAIYNQTTFDEIMEAHNAGKIVMCKFSVYVTRLSQIIDTQVYFTCAINTEIIRVICYKSNTAKWDYNHHNTAHQLTPLDNGNAQITIAGKTAEVATPQYVQNLLGTIINGDY